MRIYLIGFMGTGKSSMGQRVSAGLNVPFFDTDSVIEAQAGMPVPEIFGTHGELYFRQLEADILRQTTFYPKSIIATGGGLPCFEDNMAWMNKYGVTLYLQWPDDVLKDHLGSLRNSRPLLSGLSDQEAGPEIDALLAARKPVYEASAITIEIKGDFEPDYLLIEKACKYIW